MSRIAIIGAGAWGTGLAIVLGRNETHHGRHSVRHNVRLWANEPEVTESIASNRINERFLPGFILPESIAATSDLNTALDGAEIVVSVMPSQHCRDLFERMAPALRREILFVSCTKGLEDGTLLRMTEVIGDVLQSRKFTPHIAALSGPSFAKEVARGDPTAVTVASVDGEVTRAVQQAFNDSRFRVYTNNDVIGVELGGALKNIIAIAAGICAGLGLGHNSAAALITRGLAEMARLVVACGGRRSGSNLHRRSLAQPQRRRATRPRPQTPRHYYRHARSGGRRGFHHQSRGRLSPQKECRDADHRADVRNPRKRQVAAAGHRRTDDTCGEVRNLLSLVRTLPNQLQIFAADRRHSVQLPVEVIHHGNGN